ncbi:MAG: hypothetical protein NVSMB64_13350 [Candidatus Velthaea sp.]
MTRKDRILSLAPLVRVRTLPPEANVRCALQLLARVFAQVDDQPAFVNVDDDRCSSCDALLEGPALFCGEQCALEVTLVRYVRRCIVDGRVHDPTIRANAIGNRLLILSAGGYPAKRKKISPALRAQIIERDNHRCVLCGAPGEHIDHIAGSSRRSPLIAPRARRVHRRAARAACGADRGRTAHPSLR